MIYLASRAPDCVRHVASRARAAVSRGGGRGGRGASRGRFASPRGLRCAGSRRVVALAVLSLVLLVPSVARAEIATLPGSDGGLVAPYDYSAKGRYAAAAEAIGRNFDTLTDEQQDFIVAYDNFGSNSFVDFAMSMKNLGYEMNAQLATWSLVFPFFISNYGANNVWWYMTSNQEALDDARRDFDLAWAAWLEQNGYGDGGGSGVDGDGNFSLDFKFGDVTATTSETNPTYMYYVNYGAARYVLIPSGVGSIPFIGGLTLTGKLDAHALELYNSGYDVLCFGTANSGKLTTYFYMLPKGSYTVTETQDSDYANSVSFSGKKLVVTTTAKKYYVFKNFDNVDSLDFGTIHFDRQYSAGTVFTGGVRSGYVYYIGELDTGPSSPVYPTPPTPPEIPEPDPPETRPIDDPGVTLPPINFPDLVLPDIDYTVQTPTGTDVIPYLKKIIANQEDIASFLSDAFDVLDRDLDNIGSALGEHCNHLQQQMQRQAYWLATELQDMFDNLEASLSRYMYRVQSKLLQGIGWEFDDLSSDLISWLKRIYSRLGGNGISKPDVSTDEKGFWDWLMEQFAKFLADLAGKPLDAVDELFDLLKDFFPFSLPWDFYTMLGLLAHEPVTPVFDLPMPVPAVVSSGHTHGIHIDCHAWDDTMFVVRSLEMLFFAFKVFHMVPRWFNFIKVAE